MDEILLPELEDINYSIFKSIKNRKSVRDYKKIPLTLKEVSYLLWSAKSVPSAGGLYPLKFYLFSKNVIDLDIGLYKYEYNQNKLIKIFNKDILNEIYEASFNQDCIKRSSILIFICADFNITKRRYSERGIRYVYNEAGHSSQNIYLMATALNLGTVAVGAFDDLKIKKSIDLPTNEDPIYIIPVGNLWRLR